MFNMVEEATPSHEAGVVVLLGAVLESDTGSSMTEITDAIVMLCGQY